MNISDILPLNYWLRTRIKNSKTLLIYLVMNLLIAAIVIVYANGISAQSLLAFTHLSVFWLAYLSIYEFGYFLNDFWSLKKEQKAGINLHKPTVEITHYSWLYAAITSRLLFSIFLIYILSLSMEPGVLVSLSLILLATMLTFTAHNTIQYQLRPITFFLLYFFRYALVYPFVKDEFNQIFLIYLFLIPALGYTLIYTLSKGFILKQYKYILPGDNIIVVLRVTLLSYLLTSPFFFIFQIDAAGLLLTLCVYYLFIDFCFACIRFINEVRKSVTYHSERFHIHTKFSHDCDVEPSDICAKALNYQVTKLYITDHFETFDRWKYQRLVESLKQAMDEYPCEMITGLEYDVQGQHFLAIKLNHYVAIDSKQVNSLATIKEHCDTLIWAHPHFPIRKLANINYLMDMLKMMYYSDGIEWLNVKSSRGGSYHWRHALISFLSIAIFGNKKLIVGLDAHTLKDWENFIPAIEGSFLALLLPKSSYQMTPAQRV